MIAWRSLILSQLCASKIFSFDYSDRLLGGLITSEAQTMDDGTHLTQTAA